MQSHLHEITSVNILDNGSKPLDGIPYAHMSTLLGEQVNIVYRRIPNLSGIAGARQLLLDSCTQDYVLFLDDDVVMDTFAVIKLIEAAINNNLGYYIGRLIEPIAYRDGKTFSRDNMRKFFVPENMISRTLWSPYGVCGGFVLYDRRMLLNVGGFRTLLNNWPDRQGGEDMIAQGLLLEKFGGASVQQALAYHLVDKSRNFDALSMLGAGVAAGKIGGKVERLFLDQNPTDIMKEKIK
jgi:glycosyltransferase involved in cell wall biosynthesis